MRLNVRLQGEKDIASNSGFAQYLKLRFYFKKLYKILFNRVNPVKKGFIR